MSLDQEVIIALRKSKEIVGYLQPCVRDSKTGLLIAGLHRKVADRNWPEVTREVKDDLERELLILHYNVQRTMPEAETKRHLIKIAEILKAKGTPQMEITSKIVQIVPYTKQHVYNLLPEEYRHKYVKSQPVDSSHKDTKKSDRAEASHKLGKLLDKLEKEGRIKVTKPLEEQDYEETISALSDLSLPYPDCLCGRCPHRKSCIGV